MGGMSFSHGLGLGFPSGAGCFFRPAATAAAVGDWMVWFKKLFGFLLLGVAFYFLAPQVERLGDKLLFWPESPVLVGGLLWAGLTIRRRRRALRFLNRSSRSVLILGFFWIIAPEETKPTDCPGNIKRPVHGEDPRLRQTDFIVFYADWWRRANSGSRGPLATAGAG
jgi:thiol:disulfide interchange protein